jgi:predicted dienelactone hydrolase
MLNEMQIAMGMRQAMPGFILSLAGLVMAPAHAAPPAHAAAPALAADVPSRSGIDAPELAGLGSYAVGVRTLHLVARNQIDATTYDPVTKAAARHDRDLAIDLWYPARAQPDAAPAVYAASFPAEPPAPPVSFSVPGIAVRDAAALSTGPGLGAPADSGPGFPLVIVSHGYSNDPAAMTWLTENLASKGYVVAAIHHDDPPITDRAKFAGPLLRRPLDIVFAADTLGKMLGREKLVDPSRVALIGYSMGGYGVLAAAGASFDPAGPPTQLVPGGLLQPYVRGGPMQNAMTLRAAPGVTLRAVVAISPAGGGTLAAWGADGLSGITAPLLLIAGDNDRTVDYASGARAIFTQAGNAQRYLLTFKGAGHSIGLNPAPAAMRARLWDQDWFEDPVWRKERVNGINMHFISAFLDEYVKGDLTRAAYLNVPTPESSLGEWPATPASAYDAYGAGGATTFWKGFQRNHAAGLELLQAAAHQPTER